MKAILWFGLLTGFSPTAWADNFYSPLLCPVEEATLVVENTTAEPQSFWFQTWGAIPFKEVHIEVKAHGELHLPLPDFYQEDESAVALKTQNPHLGFKAHCKKNAQAWGLEKAVAPWKKLELPSGEAELDLRLTNLAQQENPLEIVFASRWRQLGLQKLLLGAEFKSQTLRLLIPRGSTHLTLRAQGRWAGKALTPKGQELRLEEESSPRRLPMDDTRYFLFQSQSEEGRESFVVPMRDPKLIAESLKQISQPESARLLVARIDKSLAGVNRDFSSPLRTPWSWQVTQAQNYADFAHISCDGSPQLVEERLNSWLGETGGTICFWNYRVKRELSLQELKQSPLWSPLAPGSLRHKH